MDLTQILQNIDSNSYTLEELKPIKGVRSQPYTKRYSLICLNLDSDIQGGSYGTAVTYRIPRSAVPRDIAW